MSEFSLIYQYFNSITPTHPNTVLGIGDDCAVSDIPTNAQLVSCVDTLVSGRHFPSNTPAVAIAYKSVAVNLSDLAAMGATPYAILLGLSLPASLANDDFLRPFSAGIRDICQQFNIELIGGDTTRSDVLTISVTALGFIPQGQAIRRDGAKIGDRICVSGEIGSASYALPFALRRQPCALLDTLNYPQPQIALGQALRGFASSMMDISDGLAQDLGHILSASDVGARLDLHKIPAHTTLDKLPNDDKWRHQLTGGDDYQLIFTLSPDDFTRFCNAYPEHTIYPIGQIVAAHSQTQRLMCYDGDKLYRANLTGYSHF